MAAALPPTVPLRQQAALGQIAPRRTIRAAATPVTPLLYAADIGNNAIWVFDQPSVVTPVSTNGTSVPWNVQPIREITTGINIPSGLSTDSAGDLYVANFGANNVEEFSPAGALLRTYTAGLAGPTDVKVSLNGSVYVVNSGVSLTSQTVPSNVVVYGPSSTTPTATWTSPIAGASFLGIALQSPDYAPGGDAYVSYTIGGSANGTNGILWCPVGGTQCFDTGIKTAGFSLTGFLAFQYGTFPLTLLAQSPNAINVFKLRHGTAPASSIPVVNPAGIAFDPGFGQLFVASNPGTAAGVVNEYHYPGANLNAVFYPGGKAVLTGIATFPGATY